MFWLPEQLFLPFLPFFGPAGLETVETIETLFFLLRNLSVIQQAGKLTESETQIA